MEHLYQGIKAHYSGHSRLLILFRHVGKEDAPAVLGSIVMNLPRWCRKHGKPLDKKPHAHFLYGKDVLNWAGPTSRWLLPRIAGIPVINHKVYKPSIDAIRYALKEGRFPLAFAPEGQVTYHMYKCADIAAGATVFARWAREELIRQAKKGKVIILPVAVGYEYKKSFKNIIHENLKVLSNILGIIIPKELGLKDSLIFTADKLVSTLEKLYHETCPRVMHTPAASETIRQRVENLCSSILHYAENILEVTKHGPMLERVFRLRYKIINTIYREDIDPETLPPLERTWADFRAFHASMLKRHEEIVDALEYLDPQYIIDNPSEIRMAEFSMILRDVTNRVNGGNIKSRYSPKGKTALLLFGSPIEMSLSDYQKSGSKKEADAYIHNAVQTSLTDVSAQLEGVMSKGIPFND